MASGRDEWASWKAQMKRDGKKTFKLVRGAWREKSSSAIKTITSSSDTQDATSELEATQRHENSHSNADFQYDPLPGEGFVRLLTIMPGDDEELIQLQLSTVVLDDSFGSYESLSYVCLIKEILGTVRPASYLQLIDLDSMYSAQILPFMGRCMEQCKWLDAEMCGKEQFVNKSMSRGNPKQPKKTIIINGASLEIYESLHTILMSLRPSTDAAGRVLWVDAICINQDDMIERNKQVPMMDRIYQNSRRTVVWLGADDEVSEESFSMLHDLAQDARALRNTSSVSSLGKSNTADGIDSSSLPAILQQFLRREPIQSPEKELYLGRMDIWAIFSCEWWYRAWTLQEILLSSSITLVQDSQEIDWQDFCLAIDHGLKMHLWVFVDSGTFVAEEIIPYLSIKSLQLQLGLQQSPVPEQPDFGAEGVLKLLEKCRQREAKDPRDKVYAIFGIIKAVRKMRPASDPVHSILSDPDYTNPVVYVYRILTQQLIEIAQNLDVLGVCPRSTRRGLPSWVTDWSVSSSFAVPLTRDSLDLPRRTHAALGTGAKVRFPPDAVTLVLRGHEVTTVKAVSEVLGRVHWNLGSRKSNNSSSADTDAWEEFKDTWKEAHRDLHAEAAYLHTLLEWERFAAGAAPQNPGGEDAASIYWKTLCAGTYDPDDPAKTEAKYHEWLKVLANLRSNEKRFGSFSSKINPATYALQSISWSVGFPEFTPYLECAIERRFGRSEDDWLCLLPDGTQQDDKIVLAEGGKVPLVLRPDGDGYNMFIGEAYVHGIMDGEAFNSELCQDIKVC